MQIPAPGRALALSALTVACVVLGPNPQLAAALERVYAVAVVGNEQRRTRSLDRVPTGARRHTGPQPTGPRDSRPR